MSPKAKGTVRAAKRKREPSSYEDFLNSVRLIFVSMIQTRFAGNRDTYFENQKHRRDLVWSCKPAETLKGCFELRSDFALKLFPPKSDQCFFDLQVSHIMHFHADVEFDQSALQTFANTEGRIVAWPFIREYVTSTCGRMHVPPIVLPFAGTEE